ncbi:hypothetical protein OU416_24515 [Saccharopolyspora indica]|uniref:WXG100-like domain-containing protein n=1 Tax=Saccharopolyspora indica TaxID=1229659 RepID=UPI0022EB06DB|nr:hypothetical protein [Saccharopolyspora indica]MDA3647243.1 hypothetical protein [Saccharopolyspora indica]
MSNPLVSQQKENPDGPGIFTAGTGEAGWGTGIGIAESINDISSLNEGSSWVETGLAYGGAALEVVGMAVDPIGTLLSYGLSWLIEHVEPLKEALDWFAGDPDGVKAYGETWANVSQAVGQAATQYNDAVKSDTAEWTGQAGDAYRKHAAEKGEALGAAAELANTISSVVTIMGEVVSFVREFVRDLVADCISRLITYALEALAPPLVSLAWVVPQAVAFIAKTVGKIADIVQKLVKTISNVAPKLAKMAEVFGDVMKALGKLGKKAFDGVTNLADKVDIAGKMSEKVAEKTWKKVDDVFGTDVVGKHNAKFGGPDAPGGGGTDDSGDGPGDRPRTPGGSSDPGPGSPSADGSSTDAPGSSPGDGVGTDAPGRADTPSGSGEQPRASSLMDSGGNGHGTPDSPRSATPDGPGGSAGGGPNPGGSPTGGPGGGTAPDGSNSGGSPTGGPGGGTAPDGPNPGSSPTGGPGGGTAPDGSNPGSTPTGGSNHVGTSGDAPNPGGSNPGGSGGPVADAPSPGSSHSGGTTGSHSENVSSGGNPGGSNPGGPHPSSASPGSAPVGGGSGFSGGSTAGGPPPGGGSASGLGTPGGPAGYNPNTPASTSSATVDAPSRTPEMGPAAPVAGPPPARSDQSAPGGAGAGPVGGGAAGGPGGGGSPTAGGGGRAGSGSGWTGTPGSPGAAGRPEAPRQRGPEGPGGRGPATPERRGPGGEAGQRPAGPPAGSRPQAAGPGHPAGPARADAPARPGHPDGPPRQNTPPAGGPRPDAPQRPTAHPSGPRADAPNPRPGHPNAPHPGGPPRTDAPNSQPRQGHPDNPARPNTSTHPNATSRPDARPNGTGQHPDTPRQPAPPRPDGPSRPDAPPRNNRPDADPNAPRQRHPHDGVRVHPDAPRQHHAGVDRQHSNMRPDSFPNARGAEGEWRPGGPQRTPENTRETPRPDQEAQKYSTSESMAAERPPANPTEHRWDIGRAGEFERIKVSPELESKLRDPNDPHGYIGIRNTPSGLSAVPYPKTRIGDRDYYDRMPKPAVDPKRFTVEVHGSPDGVEFRGQQLTAKELAEIIKAAPGYDPGTPIRLLSCKTGADMPDGSPNFAQQLSKELGVEVLAPNKDAWVDNFGNMYASDSRAKFEADASGTPQPKLDEPGQWVSFAPDGTKAVHDSPFPPGHEPEFVRHGVQAHNAEQRGFGDWLRRTFGREPKPDTFEADPVTGERYSSFSPPPQNTPHQYGGPQQGQQPFGGPQQGQQSFGGPQQGQQPFGGPQQGQQLYGGQQPGQQPYNAPQQGQQPYGGPQQGQQSFGGPQQGQQPYGGSQPGQPSFGGPQPSYGGPQQGQPPYGGPQQGQQSFGGPQPGQQPYSGPPPRQGTPQQGQQYPQGGGSPQPQRQGGMPQQTPGQPNPPAPQPPRAPQQSGPTPPPPRGQQQPQGTPQQSGRPTFNGPSPQGPPTPSAVPHPNGPQPAPRPYDVSGPPRNPSGPGQQAPNVGGPNPGAPSTPRNNVPPLDVSGPRQAPSGPRTNTPPLDVSGPPRAGQQPSVDTGQRNVPQPASPSPTPSPHQPSRSFEDFKRDNGFDRDSLGLDDSPSGQQAGQSSGDRNPLDEFDFFANKDFRATAEDHAALRESVNINEDELRRLRLDEDGNVREELADITDEELWAMERYTDVNFFDPWNTALRAGDVDSLREHEILIRNAVSGLNKLPDWTATPDHPRLLRGIHIYGNKKEFLDRYEVGSTLTENAFTSTTKDDVNLPADDRKAAMSGNVQFVIDGQVGGKDIEFLKPYGGMREVIFPPGTRFEVTYKEEDELTGKVIIHLTAVGR